VKIKLAIALSAIIFAAQAQTVRGVISGVVKDPSGGVIQLAGLAVINEETAAKITATTDSRGEFTIAGLLPGRYQVEAEAKGFYKFVQHLILEVDQQPRVEIVMTVGNADLSGVNVTAEPVPIRQDSSALGGVIENRLIVGLPLDGRNFY
jgi:hypothetical protein